VSVLLGLACRISVGSHFAFTDLPFFTSFFFAEEMLPLTGAEMRKYLAELEASKNPEGYVTSDPAGMSLRKLKRKEASSKGDAGGTEADEPELAADGNAVIHLDSPSSKRARTGKGARSGGSRSSARANVVGTSLNDLAMESFWHSEFDFRR
jgi:hypothetical protein